MDHFPDLYILSLNGKILSFEKPSAKKRIFDSLHGMFYDRYRKKLEKEVYNHDGFLNLYYTCSLHWDTVFS